MKSLLKDNRVVAFLALFVTWISQPSTFAANTWTPTSPMNHSRTGHTATLLKNGKVLVTGGNGLSSAEIYNPATGIWTLTSPMNHARDHHTATLLPNGKVLVAGGISNASVYQQSLFSAELYDPATASWTDTGSMANDRYLHTATLLPDGMVLVTGGESRTFRNSHSSPSVEFYDPATGFWSGSGLNSGRDSHTATLLANGKLLIAGGHDYDIFEGGTLISAELFDLFTRTSTYTGSMNSTRANHTATLLANGMLLVAGGNYRDTSSYGIHSSVELYNPAAENWSYTGSMNIARMNHAATLLNDGRILVTGGTTDNYVMLSSAEIYDPATGTWAYTGSMKSKQYDHTAIALANGDVLVAGGGVAVVYGPRTSIPAITKQPVSRTVKKGNRTTLSVGASGVSLSYQWYRGKSGITTNPIAKATSRTFRTPALKDTAKYWVKVKSPAGSVNSRTATVRVR